jgi:hypothetical protein
MKKIFLLILLLPCFAKAQVIVSQPQNFIKYTITKDSIIAQNTISGSDSSHLVPTTAWVKRNKNSGVEFYLNPGYGVNGTRYNGSTTQLWSVDTTHSSAGIATWNYIQRFLTQSSAASTYVPYTGGTADLNIGAHGFIASSLSQFSNVNSSHLVAASGSSGAMVTSRQAGGTFGDTTKYGAAIVATTDGIASNILYSGYYGGNGTPGSGTLTYWVDAGGHVHANSYALIGGTAKNYLLANGTTAIVGNPYLGTIYNKATFSNTSDFITNSVAASVSGDAIVVTGSANDFTHSLNYPLQSMLDRWKVTATIIAPTPSSTTYGVGVGKYSTMATSGGYVGSLVGAIDLTNTGTKGKLTINAFTNASLVYATSTTALTFSATDSIEITTERNLSTVTVTAINKTTPTTDVSVSYTFNGAELGQMENTGQYAFFTKTSTAVSLKAFNIFSAAPINADVAFIGDSKTNGTKNSNYGQSFNAKIAARSIVVSKGGNGDGIVDQLRQIAEIVLLKPKVAILVGPGRNSLALGVNLDTIKNQISQLYTALTNRGITTYISTGFYETVLNQSSLYTWERSTFTGSIIETYNPTSYNISSLSNDNVHQTDIGSEIDYQVFLKSGVIPTSKNPALTVNTFNNRSGNVSLISADVTNALGYEPVNKGGDSMTGNLSINNTLIYNVGATTYGVDFANAGAKGYESYQGIYQYWGTGAGASATEKMRLDAAGHLWLGFTADPASGNILAWNGNGYGNGALTITGNLTYANQPIKGNSTTTGTATTAVTVTIGSTMANTSYVAFPIPKDALTAVNWYISGQTTTQFTVNFLTALTGSINFDWIVMP